MAFYFNNRVPVPLATRKSSPVFTLSKNEKSRRVAGGPAGVTVSRIRVKPSQKFCISPLTVDASHW
jgi:hypothetical protein